MNILVDPVWSNRTSPFKWTGPLRHNPPAVSLADLPPIHAVLVTHNHYDHMDTATIAALWQTHKPAVISPLGNDTVIRKDAPDVQVQTGDWWQSFTLSDQVRVTIVPAYHWSARNLGDRRCALWGGFILDTPAGKIYCAGDTAYQDGKIFTEIRDRCGEPLVAILPIGAYDPRWFMNTQHTDPAEASTDRHRHAVRSISSVSTGPHSNSPMSHGKNRDSCWSRHARAQSPQPNLPKPSAPATLGKEANKYPCCTVRILGAPFMTQFHRVMGGKARTQAVTSCSLH